MEAIGGYFGYESHRYGVGKFPHEDTLLFNTARNAFRFFILKRRFVNIYIPRYCCDALKNVLESTSTKYTLYGIDTSLAPIGIPDRLKDDEGLLYVDYFGVKSDCEEFLYDRYGASLIADHAQAFFDTPQGADCVTIYSPRKFFGVPDGGILCCHGSLDNSTLHIDKSSLRTTHMWLRKEVSAEAGFEYYRANERLLAALPMRRMSALTASMLSKIDYDFVRTRRLDNFIYLHQRLASVNELKFNLKSITAPIAYPFLTSDSNLRERLLMHRIYTASYWHATCAPLEEGSFERYLQSNLVPLPIDQRYGTEHLDHILRLINI